MLRLQGNFSGWRSRKPTIVWSPQHGLKSTTFCLLTPGSSKWSINPKIDFPNGFRFEYQANPSNNWGLSHNMFSWNRGLPKPFRSGSARLAEPLDVDGQGEAHGVETLLLALQMSSRGGGDGYEVIRVYIEVTTKTK